MAKKEEALVYLLVSTQQEISQKLLGIMKKAVNNEKVTCIYVTFNQPAKILQKSFKAAGINVEKVKFINTITRLTEDVDFEKNIVYADSPKSLKDISIIIRNRVEMDDSKQKFVFIDSVAHILTYNSAESTNGFIQGISNKLRLISIMGKILAIKGGNMTENIIEQYSKYVDKTEEI